MSKNRAHFLKVVETPAQADEGLTIPNNDMRQITELLSRMVRFTKFRGYGVASFAEPSYRKIFIYLGQVNYPDNTGKTCELVFNPTDKPLVTFEFERKGQKGVWGGSYRGQSVSSGDIRETIKRMAQQIARHERLPYEALTGQKASLIL